MKKVVRTISGVTPLALMLKPYACPGSCIYCPTQKDVPKSYTKTSPVVLRAMDCGYDPEKQIKARLKVLNIMGHAREKIEVIIMGGTFAAYPADYQEAFIKGCFDGLNGKRSRTLEQSQELNETAGHRCVGLCLETRPDYCSRKDISRFLDFGCTRVEIGVQTLDNEIHKATRRGHSTAEVVRATKLLKDSGIKVGYHMMLGLPGSSPEKDIEMSRRLFSDPDFQPDQIKIYPTFVVSGTKLDEMFKGREFVPYTTEQIVDTIINIKKSVPSHIRIMRVMRDIPAQYIESSCIYSHLRDDVKNKLNETGQRCRCVRCREVGHAMRRGEEPDIIAMFKKEYEASGGKEVFLSWEDRKNDILISLLRMRFPSEPFRPEITNDTALIRELHTFGPQLRIGERPTREWQHRGYGKTLLEQAERLAKQEGYRKMVIISAVGARQYFRKFSYRKEGPYMSKVL